MKSKLRLFHRHFFACVFSNTIQNLPVPDQVDVLVMTDDGVATETHIDIYVR